MIFQSLKETIIKKRLEKRLSKDIIINSTPLKKIQSVGIITTDKITSKEDLKESIDAILAIKNSKIYSLRAYDKADELSYKHFTSQDINWRGEYVQTNFQSFLDQPFDLLIGYFDTSNVYLESAVLQSKAKFKVGFANTNAKLYEIEISAKVSEVVPFTKELKKYLQILKKL